MRRARALSVAGPSRVVLLRSACRGARLMYQETRAEVSRFPRTMALAAILCPAPHGNSAFAAASRLMPHWAIGAHSARFSHSVCLTTRQHFNTMRSVWVSAFQRLLASAPRGRGCRMALERVKNRWVNYEMLSSDRLKQHRLQESSQRRRRSRPKVRVVSGLSNEQIPDKPRQL